MRDDPPANWSGRFTRCCSSGLLFGRDREGVLALAEKGHEIQQPADLIKDPYVLEFTGILPATSSICPRRRNWRLKCNARGKPSRWNADFGKERPNGSSRGPSIRILENLFWPAKYFFSKCRRPPITISSFMSGQRVKRSGTFST